VIELASKGVAKSRNAILRHARGELILFADDDIVWDEAGVCGALTEFAANPDLAILLGRAVDETGTLRKRYPPRRAMLTRWNCARAATYEMVVRTDLVRAARLWFDEGFGAGVTRYLGDEYIFITDALRRGLHCQYAPITVAAHPTDSSGARFGSEADARARVAVFDRVFGDLAPLARLAFLARRPSRFASPTLALDFVLGRSRLAEDGPAGAGQQPADGVATPECDSPEPALVLAAGRAPDGRVG
jgi:hypothetical protein